MAPKQQLELSAEAAALLVKIRDRYLGSKDFNGLHIHGAFVDQSRNAGIELLEAGLIQVVTDDDYMNIHIRPWPSRRSTGEQIRDLRDLAPNDYGVCLYPTEAGMKGVRLPGRLNGQPFARAMARGKGTLQLAYFEFDVLEQYRNDSKFRFQFGDSGAVMSISDAAFGDDHIFERDHVSMSHIGFAYDLSGYDPEDAESPIVRRVTAFYCDLTKLTAEHQRRWETYQVDGANLQPHPLWWNAQMGRWPDGLGPIDRMFVELRNINTLCDTAFGASLFRSTDRPEDMGWLLRPARREWDDFILQLDKVLSDNLRSDFFNAIGAPVFDQNGVRIGTLSRLQQFIHGCGVPLDETKRVLKPLTDVRKARQKPAHTIRQNLSDQTFIHQQVALLERINSTLFFVRHLLATHPRCVNWEDKHEDLKYYVI